MFRCLWALLLSYTVYGQGYVIQTIAGSDAVGDGTPAVYASLNQAEGVAADAAGNLYIADASDHRIRKVGKDGIITTLAGTGFPGFNGDGGLASAAQLNSPYGLAVDRTGNLFVADLGNARVRKITPEGRIYTVAGGGPLPLARANDGSAATTIALKSPRNIAFDSNNELYLSDFSANYICKVNSQGILNIVLGTGSPGYVIDGTTAGYTNLAGPAGLAFDNSGNLFIAESRTTRVLKLTRGVITTAYLGDGRTTPILGTPTGIAIDGAGNLYMADGYGSQVIKLSPNGTLTLIGLAARDVAVDTNGNLYAAKGQYVWRYNANGSATLMAGNGNYGYAGDGGAADAAHLFHPASMAIDLKGNLIFADEANHRIRMVSPTGRITTVAGHGGGALGDGGPAAQATLSSPAAVAVDAYGAIYIADTGNQRIRKITPDGVILTFAGAGFSGFYGDGQSAKLAQFSQPSGLALDSAGNLYISDSNNNRIRRVGSDGTIATIAGSSTRAGFGGDGSLAAYAQLSQPRGLAFDRAGNLYVADTGNNRIRRVNKAGFIESLPVLDLSAPHGVAIDSDDSVIIIDTGNNRVRRWRPNGTVLPLAGTGRAEFSGDGGPASQAALASPSAALPLADGTVLIADWGNNRIRKLYPQAASLVVSGPVSSVVNAASFAAGPVAPGEAISILGSGFGASAAVTGSATILGGLQVRFEGTPAMLTFVSDSQINAIVPASVAGKENVTMELLAGGVLNSSRTIAQADAAVGVFTNVGGTGQAVAVNSDGSLNSRANPANRGDVIAIFVTGENAGPLTVLYAGYESEIGWSGPGQINFRVPAGFIPTGTQSLVVRSGKSESQSGVTIEVR